MNAAENEEAWSLLSVSLLSSAAAARPDCAIGQVKNIALEESLAADLELLLAEAAEAESKAALATLHALSSHCRHASLYGLWRLPVPVTARPESLISVRTAPVLSSHASAICSAV